MYAVDDCRYVDELESWLADTLVGDSAKLFLLYGRNTDSGSFTTTTADSFDGHEKFEMRIDRESLFPVLADARVYKSAAERRLMRYVSWVTSMAHVEVMRSVRPGMAE